MADEPDNMMLVMVRRIDEMVDRIAFDVHGLNVRMTSLDDRRRLDLVGTER